MQKLFLMSVTALEDEKLFNMARDRVSGERKQKADRLVLKKDKRLCVGAELLLRYALGTEKIELEYGAYKKPYLKNNGLYFNISHSEEYVICVIGDSENGCDIEKVKDYDDAVAPRVLTNDEYASVSESSDKAERFFKYWTRKESYTKAIGCGFHIEPNELYISDEYTFSEFDVSGYKCTVCAKEPCSDFEMVNVADII